MLSSFEGVQSIISVGFVVVSLMVGALFIFIIAQMVSPKFRGKLLSRNIKATKYMMDESKDDIKSISDDLANATKGGIETTVRSIKKGITEDDGVYCKHCDAEISNDFKLIKVSELPILDRYSTGSSLSKANIKNVFVETKIYEEEKIEVEIPQSKEVSLENVDKKIMTIDDFLDDFDIDSDS